MNVDDALDLDAGMAGKESVGNGVSDNGHRLFEEGIEEKGDEKHVISHGVQVDAEKGEHLTATSLTEDEFQKLLLLAEEFEASEGVEIRKDVEATGKMEGVNGGKEDSGSRDPRDTKVSFCSMSDECRSFSHLYPKPVVSGRSLDVSTRGKQLAFLSDAPDCPVLKNFDLNLRNFAMSPGIDHVPSCLRLIQINATEMIVSIACFYLTVDSLWRCLTCLAYFGFMADSLVCKF